MALCVCLPVCVLMCVSACVVMCAPECMYVCVCVSICTYARQHTCFKEPNLHTFMQNGIAFVLNVHSLCIVSSVCLVNMSGIWEGGYWSLHIKAGESHGTGDSID